MKDKFPLLDRLRDELVNHFKVMGWKFTETFPEIVFSEELIILDEDKCGLGGIFYDKKNKIFHDPLYLISNYIKDEAGERIIVYNNVLKYTAKRFNEVDIYVIDKESIHRTPRLIMQMKGADYGISEEDAYEYLYYCAVLNETGKWILAETIDSNNNGFANRELIYTIMQLPECLTALFSSWLLKDNEDKACINFSKTFRFLMELQDRRYRGLYNEYKVFNGIPSCVAIKAIEKLKNEYSFNLIFFRVWVTLYAGLYDEQKGEIPFGEVEDFIRNNENMQEIALHVFWKTKLPECDDLLGLITVENKNKYRGRNHGKKFFSK